MKKNIGTTVVTVLVVLGLVYLLPMDMISWGKLEMGMDRTVTVTGQATGQVKNEIASFSAGVTALNESKDEAVAEVNGKVEQMVESVKDFGVDEKDIKTQNLSIFQQEEYDQQTRKTVKGQWRVSNNVEVILREVDRASELADLLASSGATNVSGPRLRPDENANGEDVLFSAAVADARVKAEKAAVAAGARLGKVISVVEGGSNNVVQPMLELAASGRGGGAPIEPGSTTASKTVTVVFEMK